MLGGVPSFPSSGSLRTKPPLNLDLSSDRDAIPPEHISDMEAMLEMETEASGDSPWTQASLCGEYSRKAAGATRVQRLNPGKVIPCAVTPEATAAQNLPVAPRSKSPHETLQEAPETPTPSKSRLVTTISEPFLPEASTHLVT